MNGLKPYERPGTFNHSEAQRARREDAERERRALEARSPYDRAARAAEHAERLLREAFEALPPEAQDVRRQLLLHAVAATGVVSVLRVAADRAAAVP